MLCMNSIYAKLIIECIVLIASVFSAFITYKKSRAAFITSLIVALGTCVISFIINNSDIPTPYINRESDYSAIVLYTDEPMNIEYNGLHIKNPSNWKKVQLSMQEPKRYGTQA